MRKVFMGYTSYQKVVYDVAKFSIERHSEDVEVRPIVQSALRELGIYTRPKDENGATEFSITRFLTPWLAGYQDWVLFCDNDMLCVDDINKLFDLRDESKAVMCVKHRYQVKEGIKLDGQKQLAYPRKNWSSVVLFNAGHPSNRVLTPELINSVAPLYLHRFQWLKDEEIGEIPHEWNWLVGVYNDHHKAKMVHFTDGGPYFKNYQDAPLAHWWTEEYHRMTGKEWTTEDIVDK
jgi:lipopolysaccharide biosynthesis glycosyltransferase